MSDDKPLPFARGTLPDCDRFTVSDALDLMAGVVCPVDWESDNLAAQVKFAAIRDHHHRHELQRAIGAGQVEVFDTLGQRLMPMSNDALERAIIMCDDLQRFARDWLRIELVHETAKAAEVVPTVSDESERDDWHSAARDQAVRILERDRAKGLSPSALFIAEEIARDWRARGIVGSKGVSLSAGTIKRHALKGITLGVPARGATPHKRGK